MVLKNKIATRM
uniref:Uncharacterized protein n=1 Tax=Rhizophora mucronata TaxID=61149 RepID=A0A2P2NQU4_RHIMU